MSLSCCLGLHLYATNGSSLCDVETPPTWEKGSHLPPGTTMLGNLRDLRVMTASQLPLLNQIWDSPPLCWESEVYSPPRDTRNVTGGAQIH